MLAISYTYPDPCLCIERWRNMDCLVHYIAMCMKMEADALVSCDYVQYSDMT